MSGAAFEFTPMGPRPLAEPSPVGGIVQAGAAIAAIRAQVDEQDRARAGIASTGAAAPIAAAKLKPGSLKRQIRERLKIVKAELRRMRGLEQEVEELERMLVAAKTLPARVTPINSARKSG